MAPQEVLVDEWIPAGACPRAGGDGDDEGLCGSGVPIAS